MADKILLHEKLKEEYFKNTKKSVTKQNYYKKDPLKNSSGIIKNILHTSEFLPLRRYRYLLYKLLQNIVPKQIFEMILFAFYKNNKLSIKVMHPTAQTELNYKKNDILYIAKKIEGLEDIKEVSVFREDRINRFKKEFNKDYYDGYKLKQKGRNFIFFEEKSVGIFDNVLSNPNHHKLFEDIRKSIKKTNDS